MSVRRIFLISLLINYVCCKISESPLINKHVHRYVDLTTHFVETTNDLVIHNNSSEIIDSYIFCSDPNVTDFLAFVNEVEINDTDKFKENGNWCFKIKFDTPLRPKEDQSITVKTIYYLHLKVLPEKISLFQAQCFLYSGNLHYYSKYVTEYELLKIKLPSKTFEQLTDVPFSFNKDGVLSYRPFKNVGIFSFDDLSIHYENNIGFMVVTDFERIIAISHFGTITVEDIIRVKHSGAKLKSPFERIMNYAQTPDGFLYKQNERVHKNASLALQTQISDWDTFLPASAQNVVCFDDIGLIYSVETTDYSDYINLRIRPRFILLGGWSSEYHVKYQIPTYEYLFHKDDKYCLKMRAVDHIFNNMLVKNSKTKIILPEGAQMSGLTLPNNYLKLQDEIVSTTFGYFGTKMIHLFKSIVVENNINDFYLEYKFSKLNLLKVPFYFAGIVEVLFLLVIVLVRIK